MCIACLFIKFRSHLSRAHSDKVLFSIFKATGNLYSVMQKNCNISETGQDRNKVTIDD